MGSIVLRSLPAAVVLGMLLGAASGVAGYSAKSTGSNEGSASSGLAGTLVYSGVVSGKATFQTADCTEFPDNRRNLATFDAPQKNDAHPNAVAPGTHVQLAFVKPGVVINFFTDAANDTQENQFFRAKSDQGITWANKNGRWIVTFNNARLSNFDIQHQQSVILNGTLACTHLLNK